MTGKQGPLASHSSMQACAGTCIQHSQRQRCEEDVPAPPTSHSRERFSRANHATDAGVEPARQKRADAKAGAIPSLAQGGNR